MSQIKVMISRFYQGGTFQDVATHTVFDPRKDAGRVFSFSPKMNLTGIGELVRKNQLIPFDKLTADEFQRIARDIPAVEPQVVEVRGKQLQLEVVFDRPVYPRPGKFIHIPTKQGVLAIPVVDAYIEDYATVVFAVDAVGKPIIDAEAFVDDEGVFSKEYNTEKVTKEKKVEVPIEVKEVEVAEEQVEESTEEKPKKKPVTKRRKKVEEAEAPAE